MHIEEIDNDGSTMLRWECEGETVSVALPGLVYAEYSQAQDVVVTANADGTIRVLEPDGTERDAFEYTTPDGCELYVLASSIVTDLGVTMVVGHKPPHRGETFWQHEIDIENQAVGGPVAKWR